MRVGSHLTLYDGREYEIGETVQALLDRDNRLIGIRDRDGVRLTPEVEFWLGVPYTTR